jgi:hypothetical protein
MYCMKSYRVFFVLFFLIIVQSNPLSAQSFRIFQSLSQDSIPFHRDRALISAGLLSSSIAVIALSIDDAYYQDRHVSFHLARNRDGEIDWFDNYHRAMDKLGHIFTTSLFSQNIYFLSRWSGYSNQTSSILASAISIGILGVMEVWDAHFERWGFSPGDFIANVAGGIFPVAQQYISFLRSFDYKMSYNFLNEKSPRHGVHDYENMTFWLTLNPAGIAGEQNIKWFPNWLNLAVGVGLDSYQNQNREIYIALDYNFKRIPVRSLMLQQLFAVLDRFHLPAPAIRIAPGYIGYGLFF